MKFSQQLEKLFTRHRKIRLLDLNELFGEKSFAFAFLLLLMTAALPLPTGGITHFFEVVAALLALEVVFGRHRIWLPKRWENYKINSPKPGKGMGRLVGFVRFFEKFSRPRGHFIAKHHLFVRLLGLIVLIFVGFAFFAPPFSGLDTLPALGVVVISLGMILDDLVVTVIGITVGLIGTIINLTLLSLVISGVQSLCVQFLNGLYK
jgi:hypothetical protein